jgi:poly(3-hydroxyalkanoate) depolymerase
MSLPLPMSPSGAAPAAGGATGLVTVAGRQIRVDVRRGSGGGTPLVLCCGIGAGFEVLQPFVDALPTQLEVIRFDVPGVGGSPAGRLPYGFPQLARLLGRLVDQLGYGQVDVLGFSWGGALAQQFAAQHPRRCRRVVLVSTGTGVMMIPGRPSVLVKMASPRRFRDPDYAASVTADLYGGSAHQHGHKLRAAIDSQQLGGSRRGYLYQLAAGAVWTSLPFLWLIRQPTLVMGGSTDPIIRSINPRIMARLIPHSRLHMYAGGHAELITEAAELAPVVSDFLKTEDW